MTFGEYKEVCKKYSDYIDIIMDSGYIKNRRKFSMYQVTSFITEDSIDDDSIIGMGVVYPHCRCLDGKTIETKARPSCKTMNKYEFDSYIQMFIKNYKAFKVDLKKKELEKDFTND